MKFRRLSLWFALLAGLIYSLQFCNGNIHLFLCEDEAIFSKCDDVPDALDIENFLDLSNLNVEIHEETVVIGGSVEMRWDVEPTDRIDYSAELLKAARGGWQPTVFSVAQQDMCADLYHEDNLWFQYWGRFVHEDDRKCFNHKGTVFHHDPFELTLSFDLTGTKISGIHKIVMTFEAFDRNNTKRSEACIQMVVDVVPK